MPFEEGDVGGRWQRFPETTNPPRPLPPHQVVSSPMRGGESLFYSFHRSDFFKIMTQAQEHIYATLTEKKSSHGRCSNWIRENRRRRSAGLPQKRALPFGLGIIDPMKGTISKTLSDGTVEVVNL